MPASRNEQKFYADVDRIARALERVAAALEQRNASTLGWPEGRAAAEPMTRDEAERLAHGALDRLRGERDD